MKKIRNNKCDYPIRIPFGNRFELAIPLKKVSWEGGWKLKMDWEPKDGDVVRLFLVTPHGSIEVRNLVVEDNLLSFEDKGTLAAGTYDVDIRVVRANDEHYGCYLKGKLRIVQANDEAGLSSDTYEIDGALVLYAKGDKGDPGQDGTVSFDELSPEQIEMLKGDKGDDGTGIASIVQTQTATKSEGVNIVTVTMDDDVENPTRYQFEVRNGGKGDKGDTGTGIADIQEEASPESGGTNHITITMNDNDENPTTYGLDVKNGDKGDDGDSAYQVYVRNLQPGETQLTEEQWIASLKGEQGNQGPQGDTVILGNEQVYQLYGVMGQHGDGAMTQKAVSDIFGNYVTAAQVAIMEDPTNV